MKTIALILASITIAGCNTAPVQQYNAHVAAREDSVEGYAKDGNYGGEIKHRVEYR
jgi:hypothetical protein